MKRHIKTFVFFSMALNTVQIIAYLYGREVAERLAGRKINIKYNKEGRIRYVYVDGELAFVMRNNDGYLLPTLYGATLLDRRVVISREAAEYVKQGRNVPAKYVIEAAPHARPNGEVAVVDPEGLIVAVGRLIYSKKEITLKRGYAIKVRESLKDVKGQRALPQ
ncbi:pseudouridine synthase [Pyrobaculum aerophilum]|uniref:Pseudouridine synthase n=2 Tax=Pyrobaculum aerophilum TaxID=13773 RepID=A0A371R1S1_9CREN|nr:pseudouridine synthase [Pyrobaculum aerophilum]RFA97508.1 pseudouridine synthase [Pyrobaculum aerophilum]